MPASVTVTLRVVRSTSARPDLLLEPADLLRERRLGDVLARRGPREVLLLSERDEVAQLSKFHKLSV